jgi:hypothetical protein
VKNFESWGTLAGGVGGVSGADVRFADLDGKCSICEKELRLIVLTIT